MSFLDNITKKVGGAAKSVGDAAKTATKKTEDMVEISKLNKSISTEQDKISKAYTELGKIAYGRFKKGEAIDPAFTEGCQQLVGFEKNIAVLKEKIEEIKKKSAEDDAKQQVNKGAQAAPAEAEAKAQKAQEPQENISQSDENAEKKFCKSCGARINCDAKFCPCCGSKL